MRAKRDASSPEDFPRESSKALFMMLRHAMAASWTWYQFAGDNGAWIRVAVLGSSILTARLIDGSFRADLAYWDGWERELWEVGYAEDVAVLVFMGAHRDEP